MKALFSFRRCPQTSQIIPSSTNESTFINYNNDFSLYRCSCMPNLRLPLPINKYRQMWIVLYKKDIKTIKDFMAYSRLPEFLWNGLRDSQIAMRNKKLEKIPKKLRATRRHNWNTTDISEVSNNIYMNSVWTNRIVTADLRGLAYAKLISSIYCLWIHFFLIFVIKKL